MKLIIIMSLFSWLSPINKNFQQLICDYDLENLSIEISKKELVNGFSKMERLSCIKELNISSFWFSITRGTQSSQIKVIKYKDKKAISNLLKSLKRGDIINFTITCTPKNTLERRDKIIKIE